MSAPTKASEVHPQYEAFIAGLDVAVEESRLALLASVNDQVAWANALRVWRELRALRDGAKLRAYGVKCEACDGWGGFNVGPWDEKVCSACKGNGKVLPKERRPEWPRVRDWSDDEIKGIE